MIDNSGKEREEKKKTGSFLPVVIGICVVTLVVGLMAVGLMDKKNISAQPAAQEEKLDSIPKDAANEPAYDSAEPETEEDSSDGSTASAEAAWTGGNTSQANVTTVEKGASSEAEIQDGSEPIISCDDADPVGEPEMRAYGIRAVLNMDTLSEDTMKECHVDPAFMEQALSGDKNVLGMSRPGTLYIYADTIDLEAHTIKAKINETDYTLHYDINDAGDLIGISIQ